jgi:hypothetical protein
MTYKALCNCTLLVNGESKSVRINETVSDLDLVEASLAVLAGFIAEIEEPIKETPKTK